MYKDDILEKHPTDRPVSLVLRTFVSTKFIIILTQRMECFKTELKYKKLKERNKIS